MINLNLIFEMIIFSIIMVIFSFLVSYSTDLFYYNNIDWFPEHSYNMINGIFITSCIVYYLFSKKYVDYKCKNI